jgi:hypothetical protein
MPLVANALAATPLAAKLQLCPRRCRISAEIRMTHWDQYLDFADTGI